MANSFIHNMAAGPAGPAAATCVDGRPPAEGWGAPLGQRLDRDASALGRVRLRTDDALDARAVAELRLPSMLEVGPRAGCRGGLKTCRLVKLCVCRERSETASNTHIR